jgi:hypothetical protein
VGRDPYEMYVAMRRRVTIGFFIFVPGKLH